MHKRSGLIIALFILIGVNNVYAQSKIRFLIPVFPPYTFEKDGKIQGIGVELVGKIMKEAGIQYSVKLSSNYGRVFEETKNGSADGFFLASQNAARDKIAVFSNSIVINNWCWFYPADSTLDPKEPRFRAYARVGTYLNSNTEQWLRENEYNVSGSPSDIESLLMMLKVDRINVVFLAEAVFLDSISKIGEKPESYKKVIQAGKPFGIYISKIYLSKNPGVMEKINAAIAKVVQIKH